MEKLTRKEAIKICQDWWAKIKASGESKCDWLNHNPEQKHKYIWDCPLCEWVWRGQMSVKPKRGKAFNGCDLWCEDYQRTCPLIKQYGKNCFQLGYERNSKCSGKWHKVIKELK